MQLSRIFSVAAAAVVVFATLSVTSVRAQMSAVTGVSATITTQWTRQAANSLTNEMTYIVAKPKGIFVLPNEETMVGLYDTAGKRVSSVLVTDGLYQIPKHVESGIYTLELASGDDKDTKTLVVREPSVDFMAWSKD